MNTKLNIPCMECPFRKDSAPGWLGGETMDDTYHHLMTAELPFPCHNTRNGESIESTSHCVGAMLFAGKAGKQFRNTELEEVRQHYRNTVPQEVKDNILSPPEFRSHHQFANEDE